VFVLNDCYILHRTIVLSFAIYPYYHPIYILVSPLHHTTYLVESP
jgi:hypothetical protein